VRATALPDAGPLKSSTYGAGLGERCRIYIKRAAISSSFTVLRIRDVPTKRNGDGLAPAAVSENYLPCAM